MKKGLVILVVILMMSCNSTLEDPDVKIPGDKTLQLSTSSPSIPSNGKGEVTVLARVPKDAGVVDITFNTTAGSFLQTKSNTIKNLADSLVGDFRYASAVLISDTTKGTVYLSAEVKTLRLRTSIIFY